MLDDAVTGLGDGERLAPSGAVLRVRLGQRLEGEPGDQGCVGDGLQVDVAAGVVPLELGDHQPSGGVETEDVEPVTGPCAVLARPAVVLRCDDEDVVAEDLRLVEHPLLQVRPLLQTERGQGVR
ncbi:hypothetical protein ACI8AC_06320 [Geodermatophilus sp. SYSU D00758]